MRHPASSLTSRTLSLRAFTLLELLTVMAIIALIAAFTLTNVGGMLKGQQLTQGGHAMADQLGLARQIALSSNHPVEVRFYQYGDPESVGEKPSVPSSGKFRAMQLFEILESGTARPVGAMTHLPQPIIIDSNNQISTLVNANPMPPASPLEKQGSQLNYPIPRVSFSYRSLSFRFLADGSTDLPKTPGANWFLTMHHINFRDGLPKPPSDFFTIQIDPVNGNIRKFTP